MVLTNQYTEEAEAAIKKQRIREVQDLVDKHSMSNKEIDSCLQSVRSNCTKEKPSSSSILPDDADPPEGSQSKGEKAVDEEAKLVIDERPKDDEKMDKSIESDTEATRDADGAPVTTNNIPDDETVAMTPSGSSTISNVEDVSDDSEPMNADTLCQKFPKFTIQSC